MVRSNRLGHRMVRGMASGTIYSGNRIDNDLRITTTTQPFVGCMQVRIELDVLACMIEGMVIIEYLDNWSKLFAWAKHRRRMYN